MTQPTPARPAVLGRRRTMFGLPAIASGLLLLYACGGDTARGSEITDPTDHSGHVVSTTPVTTPPPVVEEPPAPELTDARAPSAPPTTAAPTTTEAPAPSPHRLDVVSGEYHFELSSDVVAAGPVTIAVTNEGAEPHQLHIAAVPSGSTAEDVVTAFRTEGESALVQSLTWAGGVSGIEPGATQVATAELSSGSYVMLCFIPTPGSADAHGVSHLELGMAHAFEVVDAPSPAPAPQATATIALTDFAIDIPAGFAGGEVEVVNRGHEPHELVLMRFDEGRSLADLVAWSEAGMPADRPFEYVGGTGTLPAGGRGWATLPLTPGEYVALCVVRSPNDEPHVNMGMLAPFTVS